MAFSIPVANYAEWYRLAGQFLKACEEGADYEAVEAGHKALVLAWIGIEEEPKPNEKYQAVILLEMAGQRLLAAQIRDAKQPLQGGV